MGKSLLVADQPYAMMSPDVLRQMGEALELPDNGTQVQALADQAPSGAFDPRELEKLSPAALGYEPAWVTARFPYYGLDWDITGLRLESQSDGAAQLPWLVFINGGSANFYEFLLDPLNRPGLGQYLAQKANVLLLTIPGNFKYGGWTAPCSERIPQYLLDRDLPTDEVQVRNAMFTNRLILSGLERLVSVHTGGDILIVGHSTSGEMAYLAKGTAVLNERLKDRFLGWGSGGPAGLRSAWETEQGFREASVQKVSKYPPLWQVRGRSPENYLRSGYIGPLNPCKAPGMSDLGVAERWLSLEERRRPNFKQVLQDLEHKGMVELLPKLAGELTDVLFRTGSKIQPTEIQADLFSVNPSMLGGYRKMVWVVGKWDRGHWHKESPRKARELTIADQFRVHNPEADIRILVLDMPLTHYGHIEAPREVAGCLLAATRWLIE
ncbi:MAG: hypothetical protein P1P89_06745 [Desulfobacterales bacterium]|nr:hypothetical protein [Desulfobacterales bacterium]